MAIPLEATTVFVGVGFPVQFVLVEVGVLLGVLLAVEVAVEVTSGVSVGVLVMVAVGVTVGVSVMVAVAVSVAVLVMVAVDVEVPVLVVVAVGVRVSVTVAVLVGVPVGVAVPVLVGVAVKVEVQGVLLAFTQGGVKVGVGAAGAEGLLLLLEQLMTKRMEVTRRRAIPGILNFMAKLLGQNRRAVPTSLKAPYRWNGFYREGYRFPKGKKGQIGLIPKGNPQI